MGKQHILKKDVNSAANILTINISIGENVGIIGNIINGSINIGAGEARGCRTTVANTYIINNLGIDVAARCFDNDGATSYYYSNTVVNCAIAFRSASSTPIAKDNLTYNNTTDYSGSWTQTTNEELLTDQFVDSANKNYKLLAEAISAIGQGTDLSLDANYPFDDDIDALIRIAPWDIGFSKFVEDVLGVKVISPVITSVITPVITPVT